MFSANENILLRQHKRRIVQYVEDTIPQPILDAGTNVMVMQVTCNAPGCVPLETAIIVIFPRPSSPEQQTHDHLMKNLDECRNGGTFKTKVLLPMSDVTKDDVLDALPDAFLGGRRTVEKMCLRVRDVMLGQIGQVMEDVEGRKLMAVYLMKALEDYMERGCVAPDVGEPFPPLEKMVGGVVTDDDDDDETRGNGVAVEVVKEAIKKGGNFVVKRVVEDDDDDKPTAAAAASLVNKNKNGSKYYRTPALTTAAPDEKKVGSLISSSSHTTVVVNNNNNTMNKNVSINISSGVPSSLSTTKTTFSKKQHPTSLSTTEWRAKQKMDVMMVSSSSDNIIQKLSEREHAPGIRRPGCPCCDPDNPDNIVDSMMML